MNHKPCVELLPTSGNRAFTLVDLLALIAVIAIFAGLLLPAHARATRNTQAIACLNNLEQIGRGVAMYAEEHQNYFPQAWDANARSEPWWPAGNLGTPINALGNPCGSEWLCTDPANGPTPLNQPATPAPMLMPYFSSDMAWVCPKRKRGSDYVVSGKLVTGIHPSISGYISYGFNEIGVFDQIDSTGNMANSKPVKVSSIPMPSAMVAIGECSGGNNPAGGNTPGSVWDTVWMAQSGPSSPNGSYNYRFQTSYTRHNNRSNLLYTDGHVAPVLPSSINYGQFAGIFNSTGGYNGNGTINLSGSGGPGSIPWSNPVSTPALDSQVWSATPE